MKTIFSWLTGIFKKLTLNHHVFWYFRYGGQKEDKHWFSEFDSEDHFNEVLIESRYGWLCTQFKMPKHHMLYALKNIPPLGGSMSEKLDNEIIRD